MKFEEALRLMEKGEKIGNRAILGDCCYMYKNKGDSTYKYCDMYLYGFRKKRKKIRGKLIASDFRDEIYNKSWVELMLNEKEKSIWDKLMKRLSY